MENTNKISQYEKIIEASYTCLSEKGYANVSLREIASEAGVALSQLHYYFGSKKELFKAIVQKMVVDFLQLVESQFKNANEPMERISFLIELQETIRQNKLGLYRIIWDFTSLALWSDPFREVMNGFYKDLTELTEKYIIDDDFITDRIKGYDDKDIARMILGSILGVGIQQLMDTDNEEIGKSLNTIKLILK
ncbi:MAG: TetR/AcrR family transcriptional regulator [Clostridia bacterium]|nr:TetR/AcrR family transcriptional regulator [Clostridia bacterium]